MELRRRGRIVAAAAAIAAVAMLVWLLVRDAAAPTTASGAHAVDGADSLALAVPAADAQRASTPGEPPPRKAAQAPGSVASASPSALTIHGRVLENVSREPVAGCTVAFTPLEDGASAKRGEPAAQTPETATDEAGRFRIELNGARFRLGELCHVRATVPRPFDAGGKTRDMAFTGPVRLQEDLLILARDSLRLRGRVQCVNEPGPKSFYVQAHVPRSGAVFSWIWSGQSRSDETGAFELRALVDRVPGSFRLAIWADERLLAYRLVPTARLVSPEGALIELTTAQLDCRVLDAAGEPLPGAEILLMPVDADADSVAIRATTDDAGRALIAVPDASIEIAVGEEGFAPVTEVLEPPLAGRTYRLQRLGERDVVAGRVLFEDDTPVADAYVSINAHSTQPELMHASFVATRADAEGRFRLPFHCDGEAEARASSKKFGLSAEIVFVPDGRELVLRMRRTGSVRLRVDASALPGPCASGAVEYVVLGAGGEVVDSGHDWSLPVTVSELPGGDYTAFLIVPGMDGFGQASFRVDPERTIEVVVPLSPARWYRGRLLHPDGRPASDVDVRVAEPDDPLASAACWKSQRPESNGGFRLVGSGRGSATLIVQHADVELARFTLREGDNGILRLPAAAPDQR